MRIVQVMHSLRLLSLVSHTVAPMHSLSTLSRLKITTTTCSSCTVRGGRREETVKGVAAVRAASVPNGRGGGTGGGRQLTLSADVNGLDVCNKAKRAT